jgi:hypothetical protein
MKKLILILLLTFSMMGCVHNLQEKILKVDKFQTEEKIDGNSLTIIFNELDKTIIASSVENSSVSQVRKYTFSMVSMNQVYIITEDEKTNEMGKIIVTFLDEKNDTLKVKWETRTISTILKGCYNK